MPVHSCRRLLVLASLCVVVCGATLIRDQQRQPVPENQSEQQSRGSAREASLAPGAPSEPAAIGWLESEPVPDTEPAAAVVVVDEAAFEPATSDFAEIPVEDVGAPPGEPSATDLDLFAPQTEDAEVVELPGDPAVDAFDEQPVAVLEPSRDVAERPSAAAADLWAPNDPSPSEEWRPAIRRAAVQRVVGEPIDEVEHALVETPMDEEPESGRPSATNVSLAGFVGPAEGTTRPSRRQAVQGSYRIRYLDPPANHAPPIRRMFRFTAPAAELHVPRASTGSSSGSARCRCACCGHSQASGIGSTEPCRRRAGRPE